MDKLKIYLNELGRDDKAKFAKDCGTSINYLRRAISGGVVLGVVLCKSIEKASDGAVTRQDLRPNDAHLIWDDLKSGETA